MRIARPFTAQLSSRRKWHDWSAEKTRAAEFIHTLFRSGSGKNDLFHFSDRSSADKMQIDSTSPSRPRNPAGSLIDRNRIVHITKTFLSVRLLPYNVAVKTKFDYWVTGFREVRVRNADFECQCQTWVRLRFYCAFLQTGLSEISHPNIS